MATLLRRSGLRARGSPWLKAQSLCISSHQWQRPFSSSVIRRAAEDEGQASGDSERDAALQEFLKTLPRRTVQEFFETEAPGFRQEFDDTYEYGEDEIDPDEFDIMGDEDDEKPHLHFEGDDITSAGHAHLETHREQREYARIAVWELPLLSKLAKPFEPPDQQLPLRFRYTTYLGEKHPAAKKVVVEFSPEILPDLTIEQRNKLIKLVGPRYNPSTKMVKMSCEAFSTQAQNKRYLGDLVDTLLREARDSSDTFADVPFDFRHHKPKPQYQFPERWLLTPERRSELEQKRERQLLLDMEREEAGKLVNGVERIEEAVAANPLQKPVLQVAGTAKRK